MKRVVSVLAVMALMAAMVAASAMPAFAAVKETRTGNLDDCFTINGALCAGTITEVGGSGSKGGGSGGKSTTDATLGYNVDQPKAYGSGSSQGGGKGTGGGNCTFTYDPQNEENPFSLSGNGSRCN